jgi:Mrp family chromosome partitioning ATPase
MIQKEKMNAHSRAKKTIAVMSGKGGVGKSSVTALLAASLRSSGLSVGVIDADITGPSIPKVMGVTDQKIVGTDQGLRPVATASGIKIVSINNILDNQDHPVVWRGPLLNQTVKQFYTEVNWGELDVLLIDMPPGTGDVPLTVMQSIPIDGMIMVTSPQDLARLIVTKSLKMARMLSVPILGFIENMSYFLCPDNGKTYEIFGPSKIEDVAAELKAEVLMRLPIDPKLATLSDEGRIEWYQRENQDFASMMNGSLVKKVKEMLA